MDGEARERTGSCLCDRIRIKLADGPEYTAPCRGLSWEKLTRTSFSTHAFFSRAYVALALEERL